MRLALIRLGGRRYKFVWSFHHLLLDGWSLRLAGQGGLRLLRGVRQGAGAGVSSRSRPYRDYIAWLQRQDLAEAEAFWRAASRGLRPRRPRSAVGPRRRASRGDGGLCASSRSSCREAADGSAARLRAAAPADAEHAGAGRVGAAAEPLQRGDGTSCSGPRSSGRPAELAGRESMVGLFINTLPVRVQLPRRRAG